MTVFVRLQGGLGNQMFQFAAARALAARHGADVAWDARVFREDRRRPLAIDRLAVSGRAAEAAEVRRLAPFGVAAARIGGRLGLSRRWFVERSLAHDPAVAELPDGVVLDGFFQSERYFAGIRAVLLAEFVPRSPPSEGTAATLAAIRAAEACAVHVRRGDYAAHAATTRTHGLCSPGYYRAALDRIAAEAPGVRIFVFSDDLDWCRATLGLPEGAVYVDGNGCAPEWDIALMAACRHRIIANSSFSWWGAWLGSQDGLTIAPDPWFDDPALAGGGIVPDRWLRLPKAA